MLQNAKEVKPTGGLIVAAGAARSCMEKAGSITIVKRMVLTFQQAGISPIIVITGYQAEEIEHDLANYGVIFLRNQQYKNSEMLDSAKLGLTFICDKCEQVIFSPASFPLFTPGTIQRMIHTDAKAVSPSYRGIIGHPLLISCSIIPKILASEGVTGMQGIIREFQAEWQLIETEDEGTIRAFSDPALTDSLMEKHNEIILHPFVKISIEKETLFFNSKTKMLLTLINHTNSVSGACKHMALSNGKAWEMINLLEQELGYSVVERKHGGKSGGRTLLTKEGTLYLESYQQFEQNVSQFAKKEFEKLFMFK